MKKVARLVLKSLQGGVKALCTSVLSASSPTLGETCHDYIYTDRGPHYHGNL